MTHRGGSNLKSGPVRPSGRTAVSRAARLRTAVMRLIARRPGRVLASVAAIGGAGVFGWNVLMKQPAPHPAPLFAAAKPGPAAVTPPPRPVDVAAAAGPPARNEASLPVVKASLDPASKPVSGTDPIGALIRSGEPAARTAEPQKAVQPRVAAAQKALAKLGYGPIASDGVLGAGTRQALERFERARSLPVTGSLGPRTAKQLASLSGVPVE